MRVDEETARFFAQRRRRVLMSAFFAGDPGADGFNLPSGVAITCATTGRTSQTSAQTLRTGFGANAARARSVNGAVWGLSVERAATNRNPLSDAFTWTTSNATVTHVAGPSGATEATRVADADAVNLGFVFTAWTGATIGQPGCMSAWLTNGVITSGAATQSSVNSNSGQRIADTDVQTTIAAASDGLNLPQTTISVADTAAFPASGTLNVTTGAGVQTVAYTGKTSTTFTGCSGGTGTMNTGGIVYLSLWHRGDNVANYTATGANVSVIPCDAFATAQGKVDAAWVQIEDGKYPTSAIPTTGAAASRAADVLSLSSPSIIAPGGYFDMLKVFAPHYATAEQGSDHNLLYFDANNRLFLRQADSKLVLRLGGANNTVSSALTWSRETPLCIRARHTPREQVLEVLGATAGNGVASAAAAAAISLPATAYLCGSNTGAEECSSLYAVQFQRPL